MTQQLHPHFMPPPQKHPLEASPTYPYYSPQLPYRGAPIGGVYQNAPKLTPMLQFTSIASKTPVNSRAARIIPWDSANADFVYSTINNKTFKGELTVREFKQVSQNCLMF